MAAIDTNVLVRLITRDDPDQYRRARGFIAKHKPVWVSHLTILELAWVLLSCYRMDKSKICEMLRILLEMEEVNVQQPVILQKALDIWESSHVDFADAFILESARAASEIPLGTFDADLKGFDGVQLLKK